MVIMFTGMTLEEVQTSLEAAGTKVEESQLIEVVWRGEDCKGRDLFSEPTSCEVDDDD